MAFSILRAPPAIANITKNAKIKLIKAGLIGETEATVSTKVPHCNPAPITNEEFTRMSDITKLGFETLRLDGYARFDYIMDETGEIFCLEANTLPGMTPTSLMPQEAAAVGIPYDELCDKIATLAYNKKRTEV